MSQENLPNEISDFIAVHIDSALELEILLLLRAHPERQWTAVEVDAQLRSNPDWVAAQLADLCRRGLLNCTQDAVPRYDYAPADPKLASTVAALATWYSTHRVAIISMIYSKPTQKLHRFADAFRLRREKPNG